MANQPHIPPVPFGNVADDREDLEDRDDRITEYDGDLVSTEDADLTLGADPDRPLDPDLDGDRIDSAAADERASIEGTLDGDVEY